MSSPIAHDGAYSFTSRDYFMYRKLPPETNYKAIIKEYVKGFGAICLILSIFLLAEMAFSQPTCAFDYHTDVNTCE